ncbi:putative FmdB family regulatory protein [Rhodovulum iodosum]|uniref:FmdB family regulatory protein n=1 Tax=Rhodovulum iodosum TaxID=68291 RepID=A0ABV3XWC7_9RHOB|nr:zinc ribbon domain-containing protein [Rhodovulum robiginosum]RSK35112.1 zinc ribbon domain-containing protein [Rhodovulum robiginosum]
MPIYNYRCQDCAASFERLVPMTDDTPPACPECASTDVARLLSRVSPPGKSAGLVAEGRRQAAKEGHFSNYSKAERSKLKP